MVISNCREEAAAENAEPVQLYWKADKQAIHQVDDGNLTKSYNFGKYGLASPLFHCSSVISKLHGPLNYMVSPLFIPQCLLQTESSVQRKTPNSCTRTLQSRWWCPLLRVIMVSKGSCKVLQWVYVCECGIAKDILISNFVWDTVNAQMMGCLYLRCCECSDDGMSVSEMCGSPPS